MNAINDSLANLRRDIESLARNSGRTAADIRLVGVSKTRPAADIRAAFAAGLRDFGENYLQEALPKIRELAGLNICWHFIGPIQSNKTRDIAANFDWVQTVSREKIVRRLAEHRPAASRPLNVCIQVNVDEEPQKDGIPAAMAESLAAEIAKYPSLKLRGVMAVPRDSDDVGIQRQSAAKLRAVFKQLQQAGYAIDTLSIGMSNDLAAAIAEGSTMLRIGSALFGKRS